MRLGVAEGRRKDAHPAIRGPDEVLRLVQEATEHKPTVRSTWPKHGARPSSVRRCRWGASALTLRPWQHREGEGGRKARTVGPCSSVDRVLQTFTMTTSRRKPKATARNDERLS
jgi:hypothetical protein